MHIHCPHCHNPIQVVDEPPVQIACPGCGRSIRVESTTLPTAEELQPPRHQLAKEGECDPNAVELTGPKAGEGSANPPLAAEAATIPPSSLPGLDRKTPDFV